MNYLTFSSILIVLTCSIGSLILFRESKRNNAILIWGFVTVLATIFGLGSAISSMTTNYNMAILGWRIAGISSVLAPIVHHHFVLSYLNRINKKTLYLLYTYGAIAITYELLYPEYFFGELKFLFNQFYYLSFLQLSNFPYFVHYLLAYNVLLPYSFALLLKAYKNCTGEDKNRHKYMILGSGIGWMGAHGDFLTALIPNFYPYPNILLAIFPLIVTYAIIKHQLLDIKVILKNSLVYSLSVTLITILFIILIFVFQQVFHSTIGGGNFWLTLFGVVFITFLFLPIKNVLQKYVDKMFLKGSPTELSEQNELLRREITHQEKYKAIASLASNIVHELKNPLTALKTFHEYLPERKNDPEFMKKFEAIGTNELGRLEKLSRELLDFAKPSPLHLESINVNLLITESLDLLHSQLSKNHIELKITLTADLPTIKVDKNQIKQVLINLITNAIEAMPTGGQLTIKTETKRNFIHIHIEDTGCGITTEDLQHIFEPFFSKKAGGTGLGLAICQQIITEHKGKITIRSTLNTGTEFFVILPI